MLFWYRDALVVFTSFSNQDVFEKEQSICAAEEQPTEDGVSEEWMFLLLIKETFLSHLELLIVHFSSIFFRNAYWSVLWAVLSNFGSQLKMLKVQLNDWNFMNRINILILLSCSKEMPAKLRAKDGNKRIKEPRKLQNQRRRSHWKRNLCHLHYNHRNTRSKNKLMG